MSDLVEYIGPWADASTVRDYLHIDDAVLGRRLENREILGCRFRDNRVYFPIRQFQSGQVIEDLKYVLDVLATGIDSPRTWATWLAGIPGDDMITNWEHLRAGRLDLVLTEARRDAERWNH
ncbi:MAG: hypothetical protein ABWY23_05930 [Mycetocola sp.]